MATAFLNGITIGYDDVGTGNDALLLVHGTPFNRSMWHPQVASASAGLLLAATFAQTDTDEGKRRRNALADRLVREGMLPYADEVLPKMLAPRSIAALPAVAGHVSAMMSATNPQGAAAALRGRSERPSYEETLASLAGPALIVVGSEDAFTTRHDAERMRDLIPESELVWLKGIGHMPNLETPDAFNAALVRFMDRVQNLTSRARA